MPALAALLTDLYQLTMAAGYFHRGLADMRATCELFVRRLPRARRYLIANGIEAGLAFLTGLRFAEEEIDYLASLPALRDAMTPAFRRYLRELRFDGDVWAVDEGTPMFGNAPFLRVEAPIIAAQLAETFLLSAVNHGTMIASKAARMVRAAGTAGVVEFGTRRTHPLAAVDAARAAYLVGAIGTSNLQAGQRFGIPVVGTAAHMWTMVHDSEEEAFRNYAATFPNAATLLIDTYDTVRGAERAANAAGERLAGVRLDSGDLLALSKAVRSVLDARGLREARIVASGDLNEYKITELLAGGAPIDLFGVGTELVCSNDAPSLGGVYKVVEHEHLGRVVPIAKLSEGKASYPGPHQVYRRRAAGAPIEDVVALAGEPAPAGTEPLLRQRVKSGAWVDGPTPLARCRERAMAELAALGDDLHRLEPPEQSYPVRVSAAVEALTAEVRAAHELRAGEGADRIGPRTRELASATDLAREGKKER
jgi:nicotinate phosphoribosyltransferase